MYIQLICYLAHGTPYVSSGTVAIMVFLCLLSQKHFFKVLPRQINIRGGSRISSQGGAHLKKLRRAEGGAKIFGVFRVKNHDFTPKKSYFSNFRGVARNFWGISCEKSRFYAKKIIFLPILGGERAAYQKCKQTPNRWRCCTCKKKKL